MSWWLAWVFLCACRAEGDRLGLPAQGCSDAGQVPAPPVVSCVGLVSGYGDPRTAVQTAGRARSRVGCREVILGLEKRRSSPGCYRRSE